MPRMAVEDKLHINLNQNLWCLVVGFAALGAAERWCLRYLFWPAYLFTWGTGALVFISCVFYTWHYCLRKCIQARRLWVRR
jgi:hypothetical protein